MSRPAVLRRALAGALVALLTACGGLPVPTGVRDAQGVAGDAPDVGGIVVVAPGPQPGMTAVQVVQGFLYALSRSPQDDHRIAKLMVRGSPGDDGLDPTFRGDWSEQGKRALIERGYRLTDEELAKDPAFPDAGRITGAATSAG